MAFALMAPRPNSHPFQERQLALKEPIKIGRAVAKAKATQTNGIFDCKVLSRNHAILWYENGKFLLQDTKSSNGTYVNNVRLSRGSEESEPCEVKSGDILQFGVEVVENSKNVTHGCIVGLATLFHEDGSEATGSNDNQQGVLSLLHAEKGIQPNELWQLSQFLQDALHREQMLENKLATLQRMISNSHAASDDTFQGFIQEDKVLSRLETLENQLEYCSKDLTEADAQSQLTNYQGERLLYESAAKETLQRILTEKIDVLQKCGDLERLLSNAEDECTHLKTVHEKSKTELSELMEQHRSVTDEMNQLKEELVSEKQCRESIHQQTSSEKQELKNMLEDVEKRSSGLAVEVESLQAECDFTKQQLEATKERLEKKLKSSSEDEETEKHDFPFASDHATLEKDVKNKSVLIKTLKDQILELQNQLESERQTASEKEERDVDLKIKEESSNERFEAQIQNMEELKEILNSTRSRVAALCESSEELPPVLIKGSMDRSFGDISAATSKDIIQRQNNMIVECKDLLEVIGKNLQESKDSLVSKSSSQEVAEKVLTGRNSTDDSIYSQLSEDRIELEDSREHILVAAQLSEAQSELKILKQQILFASQLSVTRSELKDSKEQILVATQLSEAHNELKDVKEQILVLGEQLVEEQEISSKSKKHAIKLEMELLQESKNCRELKEYLVSLTNLTEDHLEMDLEELFETIDNTTLEAARNSSQQIEMNAEEIRAQKQRETIMRKQYDKMKTRLAELEERCNQLKNENAVLLRFKNATKQAEKDHKVTNSSAESGECSLEDLQEKLISVNQSFEDLNSKKKKEKLDHEYKLHRSWKVIGTLLLIFIVFGMLVLLGLIDITPGKLPLLDDHTWNEILEHLF